MSRTELRIRKTARDGIHLRCFHSDFLAQSESPRFCEAAEDRHIRLRWSGIHCAPIGSHLSCHRGQTRSCRTSMNFLLGNWDRKRMTERHRSRKAPSHGWKAANTIRLVERRSETERMADDIHIHRSLVAQQSRRQPKIK